MSKNQIASFNLRTTNHDTGSLNLGTNLPSRFQINGRPSEKVGTKLFIQLGSDAPKEVTYVMGSAKKGFSVCCKGGGKMPEGEIDLQVTLTTDEPVVETEVTE